MRRRKWLLFAGSVLLLAAVSLLVTYAAFPRVLLRGVVTLHRARAGFKCQSVRVKDWNLPYLDSRPQAPRDREIILIVHGFGESKDRCIDFAAGFTDRYRVLALDLPGFGESAIRCNQDYDADFYVDIILGFLDELRIDSPHLVGYSMGGMLAAKVAVKSPDRVRTLTLLAPAGVRGERLSEVERLVYDEQSIPLTYRDRESLDRLVRLDFSRPLNLPDFIMRAVLAEGKERADVHDLIFRHLFKPADIPKFEAQIATLKRPTLLVWGTDDQILDASSADRWSQINPQIRVVKLAHAGHALIHENVEEVQREVRSQLRGSVRK